MLACLNDGLDVVTCLNDCGTDPMQNQAFGALSQCWIGTCSDECQ